MPSCASARCCLSAMISHEVTSGGSARSSRSVSCNASASGYTGICVAGRARQLSGAQSAGRFTGCSERSGFAMDDAGMLQCVVASWAGDGCARNRRNTPFSGGGMRSSQSGRSSSTNHSSAQAGIDRPRKCQSTFAHSPEPVSTWRTTSAKGLASIMKSSGGPQAGTWSGGRCVSHTWRARDADAGECGDQRDDAEDATPRRAARGDQSTDQEHEAEHAERDALEDAQRARVEVPVRTAKYSANPINAAHATKPIRKRRRKAEAAALWFMRASVAELAPDGKWRVVLRAQKKKPRREAGVSGIAWGEPTYSVAAVGAVDEFDVRHRRVVAGAEAALEDAQVAARTGGVTRAEDGEQIADRFLVAQAREREAAVGDAVDLRERDERLRDAAKFFRLRQRGTDQFVLEQRSRHVAEHRFAMGAGAAELASGFLVAHG